jgi:cytochrome c oxidase cbb3-type subunit 2
VGPSLVDLDQSDIKVFTTIFNGNQQNGMPSFGDSLGKEKIWKLVTFIKSVHKH